MRVRLIDGQNRITVSANQTVYRFSQSGALDAYPYDGTAPFSGVNLSYNQQGDLLVGGTFGARFSLLPNTQLTSDGIAHVIGTNDDDAITTAQTGGKIRFTVNGDSVDLDSADVKGINVRMAGNSSNSLNVFVLPCSSRAARRTTRAPPPAETTPSSPPWARTPCSLAMATINSALATPMKPPPRTRSLAATATRPSRSPAGIRHHPGQRQLNNRNHRSVDRRAGHRRQRKQHAEVIRERRHTRRRKWQQHRSAQSHRPLRHHYR